MKVRKIDGCEGKNKALGYCDKHLKSMEILF